MYFHPKLAWPSATYDVISRNHSHLTISELVSKSARKIWAYEIISWIQGVEFRNPSSTDKESEASTVKSGIHQVESSYPES